MAVICALSNKPTSDVEVRRTFLAIREAVAIEGNNLNTADKNERRPTSQTSLKELFTGGRSQNFRRVTLGVVIQCFQQVLIHYETNSGQLMFVSCQITGINLITYYAVSEY
jgi:hypothetical protein